MSKRYFLVEIEDNPQNDEAGAELWAIMAMNNPPVIEVTDIELTERFTS